MRRGIPTLLLVLLLSFADGSSAAATPKRPVADGAVGAWIELELEAIASHRTNPPRAARGLALVSVAMGEAASRGPRLRESAVAAAAATVLEYLYPDEAERFRTLARAMGGEGSPIGRRIGERVVRRARSDGSDAVWSGTVPTGPGIWTPTLPAFAAPLEVLAGSWRPWNLARISRIRAPAPPRPGSAQYADELREVYAVSRSLTPEQQRIAVFWADGPGTVTPPGHWNQIALELVRAAGLTTRQAARLFAMLNTAQADAFIACWDAKFTYWSERPVTAIRRELDPNWFPLIATPPFPGYVSGHSTTSGAASGVLAHYFPLAAARLRAQAEEAAVSRLYGGIHFRSDNEAGLRLGRLIGSRALARR